MIQMNLIDSNFNHQISSCVGKTQKYFKWYRGLHKVSLGAFFTDTCIHEVSKRSHQYNYAWLLESPEIYFDAYKYFLDNPKETKFTKVFTYNKALLEINRAKFSFCPLGGCWVDYEDFGLHDKNKMVSIISSGKSLTTGHKLRHSVIKHLKEKIDIYGRDYNYIEKTSFALKDYRFAVVIENTKIDYYFTEKLIDCLVLGTIPIYWGCPSIGNFFDSRGIISFDNVEQLEKIINNLSEDKYQEMLIYAAKNYELAKDYILAEDYLYKKYKFIFNIEKNNQNL